MTNLWTLPKDDALKVLLLLWRDRAEPGTWCLDPTPNDDRKSVWLQAPADPGLRAYLSTHGESPGRCAVHLEYPSHDGTPAGAAAVVKEDLTAERAIALLLEHFA
jgi:hypothetical protein